MGQQAADVPGESSGSSNAPATASETRPASLPYLSAPVSGLPIAAPFHLDLPSSQHKTDNRDTTSGEKAHILMERAAGD